jgi:hypothetical protein
MTAGNAIRKLITAHAKGDSESFKNTASEFINEERRKKHNIFADDLERILSNGTTPPNPHVPSPFQ